MKIFKDKQNILAKKIKYDFLIPFTLTVFLILGVIWLTKIISIIDLVSAKTVSLSKFVTLIVIIIPDLLFYIIPFCIIICFYIFFQNYFFTREIYIFRNIPIRPKALFNPLKKLIFTIVCFQFLLGFFIAPKAYQAFDKIKNDIKYNLLSVVLTPGSIEKIGSDMVSFADFESENEILNNFFLYRNSEGNKEFLIANFAKIDSFDSDITLKISDGIIFREDIDHEISTVKFKHFNDDLSLINDNIHQQQIHYKGMSLSQIISLINGKEPLRKDFYAGIIFKFFWIFIPIIIFVLAQEIYFHGEFRRIGLGKKHLLFSGVSIFFVILSFIIKKTAETNISLAFFIIILAIIFIFIINKANFSEKI
jgi:lipopolysaccharide export LptBFGC system permease protein LptF